MGQINLTREGEKKLHKELKYLKEVRRPQVVKAIAESLSIEKLNIPDSDKQSAKEMVDAVEDQFGSGRPSRSVVTGLLKALPTAASIASIGSLILSCIK